MKIYVLGNPLVEIDSLPIKLLLKLEDMFPKIQFIELDPSEDFDTSEKTLNLLDTALGLKKVQLIKDIDKIVVERACSLHDFDLGHNLKIMKKFGLIEEVNIIGVPPKMNEMVAIKQIKEIITNLFSRSE